MLKYLFTNISLRQTVLKNAFWLYFAAFATKCFKFFLIIAAARILGPSQYGIFTYAITVLSFIFMFSDSGLSAYLIREYQKKDEDRKKLLSVILFLKSILAIIFTLVSFSSAFFIHDSAIRSIFLVLTGLFIFGMIKDYFLSIARARNTMQYESLASILDAALTSGLGLWALFATGSLFLFSAAYLIGSFASLAFILFFTARFFTFPTPPDFHLLRKIARVSFPFMFAAVTMALLSMTDIFILKIFKGVDVVGQYASGLKLIQVAMLIPGPVVVALFPILSGITDDKERFSRVMKQSLSFSCVLSLPILFIFLALGGPIIQMMYGEAYAPAIVSFQILSFLVPLLFSIMVLDDALLSLGYQFQNMLLTLGSVAVNIVLNLFLTPWLGMNGTALATVLSQIVNVVVTYIFLKKILGVKLITPSSVMRYGVCAGASGLTAFLLSFSPLPLPFIGIVSLLVYGGSLVTIRDPFVISLVQLVQQRIAALKAPGDA